MIKSLYKCFQHWSDGGSVYLISDTHFNDEDCELMDPLWPSVQSQIDLICYHVRKNDTLIHLGDVGDLEVMKKFKCRKVLIMGNHDTGKKKYEEVFDEVYEGPLFIAPKILLSHEPIEGLEFCMNIHGHDHNPENRFDEFHVNVASNVIDYEPVNLADLINNGLVSSIDSIHRITIDRAKARKEKE